MERVVLFCSFLAIWAFCWLLNDTKINSIPRCRVILVVVVMVVELKHVKL